MALGDGFLDLAVVGQSEVVVGAQVYGLAFCGVDLGP